MRGARRGALAVAGVLTMMAAMAGAAPAESSAQEKAAATKSPSKKTEATRTPAKKAAAKAPAKSQAAKKAEMAKRRDEFAAMLIAQEKKAWEEEKNQNADFFRETMTEQFVAAEPDGKRYTKADVLPLIPTVRMTSYELTDFQVIRAGRDAAVLTYRATFVGPVEGKETTTNVLATTVWVRRGTAWKMTFHQKTLAPEKP
jgi:hypothetical protein